MFRKHINLIGFRGVGKTSISVLLHKRLGLSLYDSDRCIEAECGISVAEILRDYGEVYFRDIEEEVIRRLCFMPFSIILSTGGGVILRKGSREILRERGYNILLFAREDIIYDRLLGDETRPFLTDKVSLREEIHTLLRERESYYMGLKDIAIDTSFSSKEDCLELILSFISEREGY